MLSINDQCLSHIETNQLICSVNQSNDFYIRGSLVVKGLNNDQKINISNSDYELFSSMYHVQGVNNRNGKTKFEIDTKPAKYLKNTIELFPNIDTPFD